MYKNEDANLAQNRAQENKKIIENQLSQSIPFIFCVEDKVLSAFEIDFLRKYKPFGIILFDNNIESKDQLINLTDALKSASDEYIPFIFIDQEGGVVQRVKPPVSQKKYEPSSYFGNLYLQDKNLGIESVYQSYKEMMLELKNLGIDAVFAPVADIYYDFASKVIDNRSFGSDKNVVIELCKSAIKGIHDAGGFACIKHAPGHGLAEKDTHEVLAEVKQDLEYLMENDFDVFRNLAKYSDFAMTAHIVYKYIDENLPATISKKCISFLREELKMHNYIITDSIKMKALDGFGSQVELSKMAIDSGCDIVMQCKNLSEVVDIVENYKQNNKN